jgi:hypothetical protein
VVGRGGTVTTAHRRGVGLITSSNFFVPQVNLPGSMARFVLPASVPLPVAAPQPIAKRGFGQSIAPDILTGRAAAADELGVPAGGFRRHATGGSAPTGSGLICRGWSFPGVTPTHGVRFVDTCLHSPLRLQPEYAYTPDRARSPSAAGSSPRTWNSPGRDRALRLGCRLMPSRPPRTSGGLAPSRARAQRVFASRLQAWCFFIAVKKPVTPEHRRQRPPRRYIQSAEDGLHGRVRPRGASGTAGRHVRILGRKIKTAHEGVCQNHVGVHHYAVRTTQP